MTYREKEAKRDDDAIRRLGIWHVRGNTAKKPGADFKRSIDFIVAVHRAVQMAEKFRKIQRIIGP